MSFVEFPTLIGPCRLAWTDIGLAHLALPLDLHHAAPVSAMESRILQGDFHPLPTFVTQAVQRVQGLLQGNADDLIDLPLDLTRVTDFSRRVYEALRQIRPGMTTTYGEIATTIGSPKASRAVGGAVGRNPLPILIPCHRVLAANGQLGGFSAPGGVETKRQLLAIEGISFPEAIESAKFCFDPKAAVTHLRQCDRVLRTLIDRVGPFRLRLEPLPSPFQTLFSAIIAQQISNRAAEAILGKVQALFDGRSLFMPEDVASTSELELRIAGLSHAKIAAVKDLSAKALSGDLPSSQQLRRWPEAKIQECLTRIRGIGPWTVDMLMIFHLGRGDVLPVTDHGVRTAMAKAYHLPGLPSPKEMAILAAPWQPYRSVACWYLWRLDEKAG